MKVILASLIMFLVSCTSELSQSSSSTNISVPTRSVQAKTNSISDTAKVITQFISSYGLDSNTSAKYADTIIHYSKQKGVDPKLSAAFFAKESGFNKSATGSSGEIGIAQLMPSTAKWVAEDLDSSSYSKSKVRNPYVNMRLGITLLKYFHTKYNNKVECVAVAYNGGIKYGNLRCGGEAVPSKMVTYYRKVSSMYANLKG